MDSISIGVLTISDRCFRKETSDDSGENLVKMIDDGIVRNGKVVKVSLVPDCKEEIKRVLSNWCEDNVNLILTTGGTGLSKRDVTPEATREVVEKTVQGIQTLIFKRSSEITDLACLSRGEAGVKGRSLIINLPGSKKASKECLKAVADVIPHAVDLINDRQVNIEHLHTSMSAKRSSVSVEDIAHRQRKSSYPCVTVIEAQKCIEKFVLLLKKEVLIECQRAVNYVLAQELISLEDIPPFDASLKDGYAVLSTDESSRRDVICASYPGHFPSDITVTKGCCARITTGAAIPSGADAVVPVEDTILIKLSEDQMEEKIIQLNRFPFKNDEVRPKGSDIHKGQLILPFNAYLDEPAVGLIASLGISHVRVYHKPLVAVISTGDELVNPGENFQPGKVRDINRIVLMALLKREDFQTVDLGICPDHPDALRESIERGFKTADVVVTTGNMSMGERDYIKEVLVADFEAKIFFGRVFLKPGMPTSFGLVTFEGKPKLWAGLPGNPASAFVTSHLFLLPALKCISGQHKIYGTQIKALLENDFVNSTDRPHYVRGVLKYVNGEWRASVNENQQSSCIKSCVNANCLLLFPKSESKANYLNKNMEVTATVIGKLHL